MTHKPLSTFQVPDGTCIAQAFEIVHLPRRNRDCRLGVVLPRSTTNRIAVLELAASESGTAVRAGSVIASGAAGRERREVDDG